MGKKEAAKQPIFVKEIYQGPYNIGHNFTTSDIDVKFYVGHKPDEYGWYAYIDGKLFGTAVKKTSSASLDDMFDVLRQNAYETLIAYYKKKAEEM